MTPKFLGRDCELSTTGSDGADILPNWEAARDILGQISPVYRRHGGRTWSRHFASSGYASPYSTDYGRHWASDGKCFYIDLEHLECCTAVTSQPRQFAAQSIGTLLVAEEARRLAEQVGEGRRYSLSTANVNPGQPDVSWGAHLNVSVSTELWEDLFVLHRHPARLAFVASALAAAIPFFGAGYLLKTPKGRTIYSLSARAHHLTRLHTYSTTTAYERGLLNERREAHASGQERLHLIGFDFTLVGAALLGSWMQCLLAAAEEGFCDLLLYDPVRACSAWSRGLDLNNGRLTAAAQLVGGRRMTLPAYVRRLTGQLLKMCESNLITADVAPQATELLPCIIELAHYAEEGSLDRCGRHLDWAAKLMCLIGAGVDLTSKQAQLLDHDFGDTDPSRGLFWKLWEEGVVDPLISREDARRTLEDGPSESRDWGRGRLIRMFAEEITAVDWSYIDFSRDASWWRLHSQIEMPQLDSFHRRELESLLSQVGSLDELRQMLAAGSATSSSSLAASENDQQTLLQTAGQHPKA